VLVLEWASEFVFFKQIDQLDISLVGFYRLNSCNQYSNAIQYKKENKQNCNALYGVLGKCYVYTNHSPLIRSIQFNFSSILDFRVNTMTTIQQKNLHFCQILHS